MEMPDTKTPDKKTSDEGVLIIQELMRWVDKLYIKVLVEEKADMMKRAGEYVQNKKKEGS